jgi:hypothetical protein
MCVFNSSGMIHAYSQITVHSHTNKYKQTVIDPASSLSFYNSNDELATGENG